MRYIKYLLVIIISLFIFNKNIDANTCSYQEQTTLNNDLANIKITYEIISDNQINIIIYNLTNNLFIRYENYDTKEDIDIYFSNTSNGKYTITRSAKNIEEYKFIIYSNISSCFKDELSTKTLIKPKKNPFANLELCQKEELVNHSYCKKYITQEISKTQNEVEKTLNEYLNSKVKTIKTTETTNEIVINNQIILTSSIGILLLIIIIVVIVIIKRKRSEL